jgi:hypothetical protein
VSVVFSCCWASPAQSRSEREREREGMEKVWGDGSERHYIGGGVEETISSV